MSIPSKRYQIWHTEAVKQILDQETPEQPIEHPVSLKLEFTHGDLRRRDSDNGVSSICDMLVDAHVLSDDNWKIISEIVVKNDYKKNNAGCIISIIDV